MNVNSNMQALLDHPAFSNAARNLPGDTQEIVESGWEIGPNGALLLAALWRPSERQLPSSEVGGYEYDINDVHISLSGLTDEDGGLLARAAAWGIFFAVQLLEKGAALPGAESLRASVAISVEVTDPYHSLQGANVRFFTARGDAPDWFDDLEKFKIEAIALLDASDVA